MNQYNKIIQDLQPIISTKSSKNIWERMEKLRPHMAQAHSNYREQSKWKAKKKSTSKNGITEMIPKQSSFTLHVLSSFCQPTSLLSVQLTVNLKVSSILGLRWNFLWIFCTECACFDWQSQLFILLLHLLQTSIPGRN